MTQSAVVLGTGSYVPGKILDNDFFVENGPYRVFEKEDERGNPVWKKDEKGEILEKSVTAQKIIEMTGIEERRAVCKDETVADLAEKAIKKALQDAGMSAKDLRGIICATLSSTVPSVACYVQSKLEAENVSYATDINAACSGFTYALNLSSLLVKSGIGPVAVVGAEVLTKIVDYRDLNCALFGDGAGCAIIGPSGEKNLGILESAFISDATAEKTGWIFLDKKGYLRMPEGRSVMKLAVKKMVEAAEIVKAKTGREAKVYIPHQANIRIIDAVGKKVGKERVYKEGIRKYGNTSAATCAIGLDEVLKKGVAKKGDLVVLTAFGAGPVTCANAIVL